MPRPPGGAPGYREAVNEPKVRTPAHLADHPGELVREDDRTLVWQGEISAGLLANLMRSGSEGEVQVRPADGAALAVWIQRCWFDVGRGRMVVQLRERGLAA